MPVGKSSETRIKKRNNYNFNGALTSAQTGAQAAGADGKKEKKANKRLYRISISAWGEKSGSVTHKAPAPRSGGDKISTVCESDRNRTQQRKETYETSQLLSRNQHNNESLEQFHPVLCGLTA